MINQLVEYGFESHSVQRIILVVLFHVSANALLIATIGAKSSNLLASLDSVLYSNKAEKNDTTSFY